MNSVTDNLSKSAIDEQGICHKTDYSDKWPLFFADTAFERRPARNLCAGCPVRLECLQWALENTQVWGVWGGCDESDLRRALWVDSNGRPAERCRYPHCPACKAPPHKLHVISMCEIKTGRRRDRVECSACKFSWRAATSVTAVKSYWRERRKRLRVTVARGRIPDASIRRISTTVAASSDGGREEQPQALAASANQILEVGLED